MRILIASAYGLPHMGGIEVLTDALASELAGRGHDVTHITSTAGEDGEEDVPYRVVRVPAFNAAEGRLGIPYPVFDPRLVSAVRREVREADVVHAHGYLYQTTHAALALGRRSPARPALVLTEHVGHVPYASRIADAAERAAIALAGGWTLRTAEAIVTYNDRVRDDISEGVPAAEMRTILNGVDHDRFHGPAAGERERLRSELGWDERPRALFVGRPVAKKGFDAAAKAVRKADGAALLAVAGSDSVPGTGELVEPLGRLTRERLAEVMRAADLMLAPARGEGFPLAVQEAMASGLPVLLGDDPGYAPNLDGAEHGAVTLTTDPEELARGLTELASDPERRARAGAAAAAHARRAFRWSHAADEHERLYEELRQP